MTPEDPCDNVDLRRHVQAHIQSLRSAGVEWLPLGPPLPVARQAPASTPRAVPGQAPNQPTGSVIVAAPSDIMALDQRRQELAVLAQEVAVCTRCPALASTRTKTVFGEGRFDVEFCFVGEAPGADEDAEGIPFVGAAGQLLNKIIIASGLKREEVYICNIIKCRPPGNRTPLPDETANCKGYLQRQLELIRPKYIVALGGCAVTNLLNTTESLGRLRGRFHDYRNIPVWVTYHPAYLLPHRHPEKKRDVWEDMKMLMAKVGREIPPSP